MKKNSGNIFVVLLTSAFVVSVGIIGYFYWSWKPMIPTNTPTIIKNTLLPTSTPNNENLTPEEAKKSLPLPNPTANWKTYTNSKNGFSLKYPTDWEFQDSEGKSSGTDINSFQIDLARKGQLPPPGTIPFVEIQITNSTDHKYFSLYEWTIVIGQRTVDGIQAEIRQHKINKQTQIVLIKDGKTYTFSNENSDQYPLQNTIFDQILSTFKFL